jgi:hypothetical protein
MACDGKSIVRSCKLMTLNEAQQIAIGLMQTHIGADQQITDMRSFYGALTQALQAAHQQGWNERGEAEKLTRH